MNFAGTVLVRTSRLKVSDSEFKIFSFAIFRHKIEFPNENDIIIINIINNNDNKKTTSTQQNDKGRM